MEKEKREVLIRQQIRIHQWLSSSGQACLQGKAAILAYLGSFKEISTNSEGQLRTAYAGSQG